MKNISFLLLFVFALQFSGCKPALYKHFIDIPSNVWQKDNIVMFKVKMEQALDKADVRLAIRYVEGYFYDHLKVKVVRISPSNKKLEKDIKLKMMDSDGRYQGEGMGDLWDLEESLMDGFERFEEAGTYHYEFSQTMKDDQFPLVVEVGLIVESVE
ncbi:MAG: gliding motility lipoprotein GldH [Chitinophagales bacterium]